MNRVVLSTLLFLFALSSSGSANDNSQATLGDIKEAVYKLILINNKRDKINVVLGKRTKDKYDNYIDGYVKENNNSLVQIEQGKK